MNCKKCGEWISVDDYLDYDGLCPYCDEEKETQEETQEAITLSQFKKLLDVINDPPTYSIPFLGNPSPEVQDYIKRMDEWYCRLLEESKAIKETKRRSNHGSAR